MTNALSLSTGHPRRKTKPVTEEQIREVEQASYRIWADIARVAEVLARKNPRIRVKAPSRRV